jgi:hypothetical protein
MEKFAIVVPQDFPYAWMSMGSIPFCPDVDVYVTVDVAHLVASKGRHGITEAMVADAPEQEPFTRDGEADGRRAGQGDRGPGSRRYS